MKKGLYDKVLSKELEYKLSNEVDNLVVDLKEEELDNACIEVFYSNLGKMTTEEKKSYLSSKLEVDKLRKLVAIEGVRYKAIYPETKFDDVALFTGSVDEPTLMSEFKKELVTTDKFQMLVSFVKKSGIAPIIDDLKEYTDNGGKLEVITTTYTKASDFEAIMDLANLRNTIVKISYDVNTTRLHAKSYLFIRNTGLDSVYIGSSNFSHPAMTKGLEWNVKLTTKNNLDAIFKFKEKFEHYWGSNEFETLDINEDKSIEKLKNELNTKGNIFELSPEMRPFNYQEHLLQQLQTERNRGNNKNLLIAATGTGKTVIAAFDFKRYKNKNSTVNILFVAHRKEIVSQALKTYRKVLVDYNFGSLLTGDEKPTTFKNLFATIQTVIKLSEDVLKKFDYIVVDEVHHIAASSYEKILNLSPKILLGLTATPFRGDNNDILTYFNNKPSAELNLIDAINNKMLCPFNYFGISDSVDLSKVQVVKGRYNQEQLDRHLMDNGRVDLILSSIRKYTIQDTIKCIGFCTSIVHANYMAKKFKENNLKAVSVTSKTDKSIRDKIPMMLSEGEIQYVFVVDMYNEGIDIPTINTVLFLRPTNSAVIYLQQLGRGLRLDESKDVLTVLDFIGNNNKDFRFANNLKKIVMKRNIVKQIEDNTLTPPLGCEISIEKKAREYILDNLSKYSRGLARYYNELYEEYGYNVSLEEFIIDNNIDIFEFYSKTTITNIRSKKNITKTETMFTNLISNTDVSIFETTLEIIEGKIELGVLRNKYSDFKSKVIEMSIRTLLPNTKKKIKNIHFIDFMKEIEDYKVEIIELINYIIKTRTFEEGDYLQKGIPLKKNCKYSKLQIKTAFNRMDQPANEGVTTIDEYKQYLLYVTLHKDEKREIKGHDYEDELLGDTRFRWISDGTPKRENNIINQEYSPILFIRQYNKNEYGSSEYFEVIGECEYIEHKERIGKNIVFEYKIDGLLPNYST